MDPDEARDLVSSKVAGFSYEEIGEQTGDSWHTIDRQLVRARRNL
jgi:DNA-directed RNA polymerase specialized sigma24 family protein